MIIPKIWSLVGGIPTPLKNDGVKVSWEYEIPNIWENQIHVPNHQPVGDLTKLMLHSDCLV